jgi:small subunit ribosomal protein S17|tara:strand:- start:208 stop:435 length:228 start_codon:yes stop_codon:yes gene_type:complete
MTKKELKGIVIKDQNDKTVVVMVKRRYSHPLFGKVITSSKNYQVHDEKNKFKVGDNVKIIESIPYSKKKRWKVID